MMVLTTKSVQTVVNPKNASVAKHMLELIAQRSGEERANVFLDIIIDIIFHKGDSDVWTQQQILNRIAEVYGVTTPTLKVVKSGVDDVPF